MKHAVALLVVVVGCGGGDGGPDGGGGDDGGGDGAPVRVAGRILIEETDFGGPLGEVGSAYARFEAPSGDPDRANDGVCRVYEYPCLGQVGACGLPPGKSAGTITVTGLRQTVTLTPNEEGFYSTSGGLPDDLFDDGATVTATAEGDDDIDGFTLATTGVEPLVSPFASGTTIVPGQPLDLTWTAGTSGARIRLHVNWADICHAGAEWYILDCDVPDTGAFTVPAAITSALPSPNFGACGAQLSRVRPAALGRAGADIELVVASADYLGLI